MSNKTNPSTLRLDSEAELREEIGQLVTEPSHLRANCSSCGRTINKILDLIHEREKQARREVKEEVLDTVMGIDARFNPSPSDVRNKIIKAIESLEEEE